MSMRRQFVRTVENLLVEDERLVLLLGDIGVFGFKKAFQELPDRVYNIGILEPTTVSLSAGLAKNSLIPIVHTIAPFLAERAFEQIKIDFGYQHLNGNFVSVGGSYDYASLGCTHHCPGDIGMLLNIPSMEIIVPGTAAEFDTLFQQAYNSGQPTYFRLSERENMASQLVQFGKANILKTGTRATVVAIGPVLQQVLQAASDLDVSILYYTTLAPFDSATLRSQLSSSGNILLVEPFYSGTLTREICDAVRPKPVVVECVGVPRAFLTHYGHAVDHDIACGLTPENIRSRLEAMING